MTLINDICMFLDSFAPTRLAEDWDNVGLLVGDPQRSAERIMTCLTVTPETSEEAISQKADLIVSHHPLPFRPIKTLTTNHTPSRLLWDLIRAGISIYSPHTGFDSAGQGINQSLAERLNLAEIEILNPIPDDPESLGSGRIGLSASKSLNEMVLGIKEEFQINRLQIVGDLLNPVSKVAVACGSGGAFLDKAIAGGCDTFVTGEATFHTCLEAKANDVSLILLGHFASERFAVDDLATRLAASFIDCQVWSSREESDPLILA